MHRFSPKSKAHMHVQCVYIISLCQVLERPRTVSTAKHSYRRSQSPPKRPSTSSSSSSSSSSILLQSEEEPVSDLADTFFFFYVSLFMHRFFQNEQNGKYVSLFLTLASLSSRSLSSHLQFCHLLSYWCPHSSYKTAPRAWVKMLPVDDAAIKVWLLVLHGS